MILRNDIQDLPQGTDVAEKDVFYQDSDYLIREIYIRKKGKGNALNEGIRLARNDWFTILPTLPYMYYFSSLSLIPAPKDWVW